MTTVTAFKFPLTHTLKRGESYNYIGGEEGIVLGNDKNGNFSKHMNFILVFSCDEQL